MATENRGAASVAAATEAGAIVASVAKGSAARDRAERVNVTRGNAARASAPKVSVVKGNVVRGSAANVAVAADDMVSGIVANIVVTAMKGEANSLPNRRATSWTISRPERTSNSLTPALTSSKDRARIVLNAASDRTHRAVVKTGPAASVGAVDEVAKGGAAKGVVATTGPVKVATNRRESAGRAMRESANQVSNRPRTPSTMSLIIGIKGRRRSRRAARGRPAMSRTTPGTTTKRNRPKGLAKSVRSAGPQRAANDRKAIDRAAAGVVGVGAAVKDEAKVAARADPKVVRIAIRSDRLAPTTMKMTMDRKSAWSAATKRSFCR